MTGQIIAIVIIAAGLSFLTREKKPAVERVRRHRQRQRFIYGKNITNYS